MPAIRPRSALAARADYFLKYLLPPLAWAGLIYYLSAIPRLKTPLAWDFILRKIAHACEYAVLCALIARALAAAGKTGSRHLILAAALTIVYAAADEYHQSFVPNRFCSAADVLIDSAGALAGLYFFRLLGARSAKPRPEQ